LRDERRFDEAVKVFEIAAKEGPSSYFIYGELADCYDQIGDKGQASKYRKMFENPPTSDA
jgi:uncharacterized protein HemY